MKRVFLLTLVLTLTINLSTLFPATSEENTKFVINPYHPIIIAWQGEKNSFDGGYVIGGSKAGKWFTLYDFKVLYQGKLMTTEEYQNEFPKSSHASDDSYGRLDLIKGGETFKFYSNSGLIALTNIGASGLHPQWSTGDLMLGARFAPFNSKERFLIGVNGVWNALPRIPKPLAQKNSYLIDIEGDGQDETILIETIAGGNEHYKDALNLNFFVEKNGSKILVRKGFTWPDYMGYCSIWTLDLNGDGCLELITKVSYGYGISVNVYEFSNGKVNGILGYYDGD